MTRYLITSALPYINGVKHLGNLIGSMLPADVFARFLRQEGKDVLYICGTDDHGTPSEIAAIQHNQPVADFCNSMFHKQREIYEGFSISFDYFGRTSSPTTHKLAQKIFKELDKNGYLEEHEVKQVYSKIDKRFLPDRYVIGVCPFCEYDKARGDQCEHCGQLLDASELINPYSAISGSKNLEIRYSKHIYINFKLLENKVADWVALHPEWNTAVKGVATKWLKEGLKKRCISRDLEWGVRVPKAGYEDKVFYVWFDALISYISITQDWAKKTGDSNAWKNWWNNSSDVEYYQFMAKDNLPFHTIFGPAIMIGSGTPYKMVDYIKGFNWLTYEGGKFSTSLKRGVFSDEALSIFPSDYWRYYLLANAPESSDSNFTFKHFAEIINKDLANILGNFISRVFTLLHKHFEGKIVYADTDNEDVNYLVARCEEEINGFRSNFYNCSFRSGMKHLRSLWSIGNEYITKHAPWELIKTDKDTASLIVGNCLHLIRIFSIVSSSVIPNISAYIYAILCDGSLEEITVGESINFICLEKGRNVKSHDRLIKKISDEKVQELVERYGGS